MQPIAKFPIDVATGPLSSLRRLHDPGFRGAVGSPYCLALWRFAVECAERLLTFGYAGHYIPIGT